MKRILNANTRAMACLCAISLLLTACVTSSEGSRLGDKADAGEALKKYTELGLRYIQQGDTVKARKPLKRALEISPKSPEVHNALAILFQREQEPQRADEHFKKAIQYGPGLTRIYNNYAAFLFGQQRYAEACEQLEVASEDSLYDFRASVYENLGVCYQQLNKVQAALKAFERAIDINKGQARALIEAADIYFDQGDIERSGEYHRRYQKMVRLRAAANTPKNLWLGVRLARLQGDKNNEASYGLMLKNVFPDSREYQLMRESGS